MLVNSAGRGLFAAAVAFLQCDDPLKRTRVARFYCADFFACHKKEAVFGRFVV